MINEHDMSGSYEVASGMIARDCSCGYFILGKDFAEVDMLVEAHLNPPLSTGAKVSLAFLESLGYNTEWFVESYDEPQRVYHGRKHIETMIDSLLEAEKWQAQNGVPFHELELTIMHLAAWYHYCVYVPGQHNNELLSAVRAFDQLSQKSVMIATEVRDIVLSTQTHESSTGIGIFVVDADLAGLGASSRVYRQNSDKVKAEYGNISDELWKAGRVKFLEGFLARPTIYLSPWGMQFEQQARANMQAELDYLRT